MNDKQKEFILQEIEGYEDEAEHLRYKTNRQLLVAFLSAGLTFSLLASDGAICGDELIDRLIGIISGSSTILSGTFAIKNTVKRESLNHTVRMLQHEAIIDELSDEKPKVYTKKSPNDSSVEKK